MTNDIMDMERQIVDLIDDLERAKDDINFWRMSFEEEYELHGETKARLERYTKIMGEAATMLMKPNVDALKSQETIRQAHERLGLAITGTTATPDLVGV